MGLVNTAKATLATEGTDPTMQNNMITPKTVQILVRLHRTYIWGIEAA